MNWKLAASMGAPSIDLGGIFVRDVRFVEVRLVSYLVGGH